MRTPKIINIFWVRLRKGGKMLENTLHERFASTDGKVSQARGKSHIISPEEKIHGPNGAYEKGGERPLRQRTSLLPLVILCGTLSTLRLQRKTQNGKKNRAIPPHHIGSGFVVLLKKEEGVRKGAKIAAVEGKCQPSMRAI